MIATLPEWGAFMDRFSGGTVYLLGKTDTGKSTFCRFLVEQAAASGRVAYLDGDCGQSTIGPPATAGLAVYDGDPGTPVATCLRFIGSISPAGHLLPLVTALKRLAETAALYRPQVTVVDSPGYVEGEGAREFHASQIELLHPDHVVAIQEQAELEEILAVFRHHPAIQVHRFRVSPAVKSRSRAWRARYREERFRAAFAGAWSREIATNGLGFSGHLPDSFRDEDWAGRLLGLCDADQFLLAPAIADHADPARGRIRVYAPAFDPDRLVSVRVGVVRLDRDRWEDDPVRGRSARTCYEGP